MKDYKILALDETGKASFNHLSNNFILSGLIMPENFNIKLNNQICKLKKKHFNNESVVLHCRDIMRKKGPFACLAGDIKKEINFWSDLIGIINNDNLSVAFVITDKDKAKKLGWNDIAILKRTYNKMLEEFTKKHLTSNKGKILVESDPYQDKYLIEAHNRIQSCGIPSEGISGFDYRNKITSLSLVNKLNLDVEIQLADSLALMADLVYKIKMNNKSNPGIFEILA
jgi:hypothetical protein